MKSIFIAIILVLSIPVFSQDDVSASAWKHSLVSGLTITQMSFSDWAGGGENSLAYAAVIDGTSIQDLEKTNWSNTYKLSYGQARLGSKGLRKTDDKIEFESVLSYKMETHVNPYISASLKTQFDVGYKYDDAAGTQNLLSRFWAPAYLMQSAGVGYQPIAEVKTRIGIALREVRSKSGYIENNKTEGGMESITDVEWHLGENLLYKGKLELFSAFQKLDLLIVRSDNTIAAKVSNWVSVTLNVQFVNDANLQARTQIKEVLGLGIVYTFI